MCGDRNSTGIYVLINCRLKTYFLPPLPPPSSLLTCEVQSRERSTPSKGVRWEVCAPSCSHSEDAVMATMLMMLIMVAVNDANAADNDDD